MAGAVEEKRNVIKGPNFEIIPKLAPAYAEIIKSPEVKSLFDRLQYLDGKTASSAREEKELREEVGVQLNKLGRIVLEKVENKIRAYNPTEIDFEIRLKAFEKHFRHPTPEIDLEQKKISANCVANAIVQSMVLSQLGGGRTGVFSVPGHVVPAVKIRGTTYVLDTFLLEGERAPSLREYVRIFSRLHKAYDNPNDELHPLARIFKKENLEMINLVKTSKYFGGEKAAISSAYSNFGNALLILGKREDAIKHFEKALELNPNNPMSKMPNWKLKNWALFRLIRLIRSIFLVVTSPLTL
jgi:tetratricopeptide (TPR) repeat protein